MEEEGGKKRREGGERGRKGEREGGKMSTFKTCNRKQILNCQANVRPVIYIITLFSFFLS